MIKAFQTALIRNSKRLKKLKPVVLIKIKQINHQNIKRNDNKCEPNTIMCNQSLQHYLPIVSYISVYNYLNMTRFYYCIYDNNNLCFDDLSNSL